MSSRPKLVLSRLALVAASILAGLGLVEALLRIAHPRYEYSAESKYRRDNDRIWARAPNLTYHREHPDTGIRHLVHHNNLALRQHRDFSATDLRESTVLGFFGDSYVENLRLPAQFSFTEPLDFLLNQSGGSFNVLNFGVDGYGTDQSFLHYSEFVRDHRIDHVFYVFSSNDLRNIEENRLFERSAAGGLIARSAAPSPWWVRAISHFYLTYFLIERIEAFTADAPDAHKVIHLGTFLEHAESYQSPRAGRVQSDFAHDIASDELRQAVGLLTAILREWKHETEDNGGRFHIVLLPRYTESQLTRFLPPGEFHVIDLEQRFADGIENFDYQQITFENDGHWNEWGNALAARHLYEAVAPELGLPPSDPSHIESLLNAYALAFPAPEGKPARPPFPDAPTATIDSESVRARYLAAE